MQLEVEKTEEFEETPTGYPLIGEMIRKARLAKNMSLKDLSAATQVSIGLLSQIERERANPSMKTIWKIREVLQMSNEDLFGPRQAEDAEDFVLKAGLRPKLDFGAALMVKELLSSQSLHQLEVMILDIQPGGGSGGQQLSMPSEKAGLVLEGEIMLRVDDREVRLTKDDSFHFEGSRPHGYRNCGKSAAKVLWIISHGGVVHRHT